jgi:hypothetical protein
MKPDRALIALVPRVTLNANSLFDHTLMPLSGHPPVQRSTLHQRK